MTTAQTPARIVADHAETVDLRAVLIARKVYAVCFEGYYNRTWEDLPASQQYRFIRAGYAVQDLVEDWE